MKPARVLFKSVHGSHLYGLATPKSDRDVKGVVLPSGQELFTHTAPKTAYEPTRSEGKKQAGEQDEMLFTLEGFLRLCEEGQTVATELLFTPRELWLEWSPEWEELVANRDRLLHKKVDAFYHYARTQSDKYGNKGHKIKVGLMFVEWCGNLHPHARFADHRDALNELVAKMAPYKNVEGEPLLRYVEKPTPQGSMLTHLEYAGAAYPLTSTVRYVTKEVQKRLSRYGKRSLASAESDGSDFKALSHALRVGYQSVELLTTGKLTFPRPEKDRLLAVKLGQGEPGALRAEVDSMMEKILTAKANSTLPEQPDMSWATAFQQKLYRQQQGLYFWLQPLYFQARTLREKVRRTYKKFRWKYLSKKS